MKCFGLGFFLGFLSNATLTAVAKADQRKQSMERCRDRRGHGYIQSAVLGEVPLPK